MKKLLKSLLFGNEPKVFTLKAGVGKGLKMMIDPNHRTQRIIGLDEYELQSYYKKFSPGSNIYIDLGSSDAYYPLIYRKFNPTGQIYSFEVQQHLVEEQPKNFLLNGFSTDNFQVISKYASDIDDSQNASLDTAVPVSGKKVFIKIDIEGAELKALNGMKNLLRQNKCYLVVETHSAELERQCLAFLDSIGYKTHIVRRAWFRKIVPEKRVIEHNQWFTASNYANVG